MRNFNHLYYFYIVAKLKNVTSAAKFLKTSQPSISTQIKTLENNINQSLFTKKGKYLELTEEGSIIYNYCSRMFHVYDDLEKFLHGNGVKNEIRIGFCTEISRPFISSIVNEIMKKYKTKNRPLIKLSCSNHETLLEKIKTNKLDFILTNVSNHDFELSILKEFKMPIILVGTNSLIRDLGLNGITRLDLILKKAVGHLALPSEHLRLRIETNVYLFLKKLNYKTIFESDILSSIVQSTLEGITFGLLPKAYVHKELQNKTLKNLSPQKALWYHHLFLIGKENDTSKDLFLEKMIGEIESAL